MLMAPCLSRIFLSVLLIHMSLSAPGQPQTHRDEDSVVAVDHPFQSTEESHRLLRSYIGFVLNKEDQGGLEVNSREQEVFFLVRLHDYDRSGFLDGLEMIKLLHEFNTFHSPGVVHSNNEVVSVVDFLLQTQDLNHDGLFSPSELLSPPLLTQHEEAVKDRVEDVQNEVEDQTDQQLQQGRKEEDTPVASVDEMNTQHKEITEEAENMAAPVHQGQPEI